MRFAIFSILIAVLAAVALAKAPLKSVIVSYPDSTPNSVVEHAKAAITEAGGIITHEYNIIKAFACNAPASILESVQAWGNEYSALVEEDSVVTTNGGGKE